MGARAAITREWEAAHAMLSLYGGSGMGAQRAAWQAAYGAQTAATTGLYYAQSVLDLVKALERLPHWLIVAAATKHRCNLFVLRLSLAAYRLPRAIGIDGVYSRLVVATLASQPRLDQRQLSFGFS